MPFFGRLPAWGDSRRFKPLSGNDERHRNSSSRACTSRTGITNTHWTAYAATGDRSGESEGRTRRPANRFARSGALLCGRSAA